MTHKEDAKNLRASGNLRGATLKLFNMFPPGTTFPSYATEKSIKETK